MEFKSAGMDLTYPSYVVLIETLWNVNWDGELYVFRNTEVLIETLWNVNALWKWIYLDPESVLIETLWNVNLPLWTISKKR